MSDTLVDLKGLQEAKPPSQEAEGEPPSKKPISLAALKFTSDNIEVAKELTTEGISEDERMKYIRKVSTFVGSEVFEFSTCNRVLYVGFDIEPEALSSRISEQNGAPPIPIEF